MDHDHGAAFAGLDPIDLRTHRGHHRQRHRPQPAPPLFTVADAHHGHAAGRGQCDQSGRRPWRDGRRTGPFAARAGASVRRAVRPRQHSGRSHGQLRTLCQHPQMDHALAVFLYRGRARRGCRLGQSRPRPCRANLRARQRSHDGAGRHLRHDNQPLPVLLAIRAGSGRAQAPPCQAAVHLPARGGARTAPHPQRYTVRHGLFQHHRNVDHDGNRRHAPRQRHDRYPIGTASRIGPAPHRGRICLCPVCAGHHRHGPARRAGAGRLRGLCRQRDVQVDRGPRPQTARSQSLLCRDRAGHAGRRCAQFHRH